VIFGVLVGIIEVFAGRLDSNDEVEGINQVAFKG
jgi:hypothetical protein